MKGFPVKAHKNQPAASKGGSILPFIILIILCALAYFLIKSSAEVGQSMNELVNKVVAVFSQSGDNALEDLSLSMPVNGSIGGWWNEDGQSGVLFETEGADVSASAAGSVQAVGELSWGQYVLVDSGEYKTLYVGFSNIAVAEGDVVALGGKLGEISEGKLYLQVWNGSSWVDPRGFFTD